MARPRPTMRGNRWMAPMSEPARPTLTNRNARLARSDSRRKSLARARAAPAPAATPLTAAMMGFSMRRMLPTTSQVRPGEAVESGSVHLQQLADDVVDAAARAEALAGPGEHQHVHPPVGGQRAGEFRQLFVGAEGQGVELRGIVETDRGDAAVEIVVETVICHAVRPPRSSGHDGAAVHVDGLSGDGVAGRARQQHRQVRHLARAYQPPLRGGPREALQHRGPPCRRRAWPSGARSRA